MHRVSTESSQPPLSLNRSALGLAALAFVLLASYAVARPAAESLFLEHHGSSSLPAVWVAVALVSAFVVTFYNRFAASVGLLRLYAVCAGISALTCAALLVARHLEVPGSSFAIYVWKDVYIVVLIEVFWSYANTRFPLKTARWLYGFFCVMGSLGGMAGNLGVGLLAAEVGTASTLWALLPLLALTMVIAIVLERWSGDARRSSPPVEFSAGFRVLQGSPYLVWMLALIGVVQVVITLVDYQFNVMVEAAYPDTDARTAVIGKVYAAIDVGSLSLQALTGLVLRYLGVAGAMLGIPVILGLSIASFAVVPRFATLAVAKVASKVLDYSLFRASKEILYLPLGYEEKTQGKAIIDMLTYRVAKGAVSLLLMVLVAIEAGSWVLLLAGALLVVWLMLARSLTARWKIRSAETSQETA